MTEDHPQRIARLTPLAEVLALIDARVKPIEPRERPPLNTENRVLAEDIVLEWPLPSSARALRDGYAVKSEMTLDASSYAPVPLAAPPLLVDVGEELPLDTDADAVAPLDAVLERNGRWEVVAPVLSGEGMLQRGADFAPGTMLRRAGQWLRNCDVVALTASGRTALKLRIPRVAVVCRRTGTHPMLDAAIHLVATGVEAAGGQMESEENADFVVAIGGTGTGRHDASVRRLDREGEVLVHGIAIAPGETAAFGFIRHQPVLLIPGRIDAAFAVWQLLGWRILARLAGRTEDPPVITARLTRKVPSNLGLAELVLLRLRDGEAAPIASGYLPLSALVQANGWILIPPGSEGYPPGAEVMIRPCA